MRRGLSLIFAIVLFVSTLAVTAQQPVGLTLRAYLESKFKSSKRRVTDICPIDTDPIALRVFTEYGSMFAGEATKSPDTCLFPDGISVDKFHREFETRSIVIGEVAIELQKSAASALEKAIDEAVAAGRRVTPLDGAIAGKRTYADTLRIWNSRFLPALDHWVAKRKITRVDAETAIRMPLREQIKKVVEWEAKGYYFSTNRSKSIFYSVAPPGTSQHLSLIAFDVVEASDSKVREIMNKHGWYQTIKTDEPHFTYLGVSESELPSRGLKKFVRGKHTFWIPNM